MKEKFLWIGLSLIILSWIGNSVYYQSKQIQEPIFLDHYYSFHMSETETRLRFYFLANKNDNRSINYATIDGIDIYPERIFASRDIQYSDEFSHQYLRYNSFLIDDYVLQQRNSDEPWIFEKVNFTFSDGETIEAEIGKIEIFPFSQEEIVLNPYHTQGSYLYSTINETGIKPTTDVTVDHIEVPFQEIIGEHLKMKMSKADEVNENELLAMDWSDIPGVLITDSLFPKNLLETEKYSIISQVNPEFTAFVQLEVLFKGQTEDGKPFTSFQWIESGPNLNEHMIQQVIDSKGGDSK